MALHDLAEVRRNVMTVEKSRHLFRWVAMLAVVLALSCGTVMAQAPFMFVDDASIFEGNAGTSILKLPVRFVGTQNSTVTGTVSATPMSGTGFNTPVGGGSCGGSVDFQQFNNSPFSIPPNTPNGTLTVNITICGDAAIEPNEHIFVSFSNVVGADCSLEGACNAIGTITDDDGPPAMSINNVSVSVLPGQTRSAVFTVSLNHSFTSQVSAHFATRDGTAKAQTTTNIGAYQATNGTVMIPAGSLSATIGVTVLGHGGGTFFVDLSIPTNSTIADGTGQGTIKIVDLTIGNFEVSPDDVQVKLGERKNFAITWTVPDGEVWRDLSTLDIRIGRGSNAFWIRWSETPNTFRLCRTGGNGDDDDESQPVNCSAGVLPGSGEVLESGIARLYLADSSVVGSGPTGQSVTLNLSVEFLAKAAGHLYDIELAATDDFNHKDSFVDAATVRIEKPAKH